MYFLCSKFEASSSGRHESSSDIPNRPILPESTDARIDSVLSHHHLVSPPTQYTGAIKVQWMGPSLTRTFEDGGRDTPTVYPPQPFFRVRQTHWPTARRHWLIRPQCPVEIHRSHCPVALGWRCARAAADLRYAVAIDYGLSSAPLMDPTFSHPQPLLCLLSCDAASTSCWLPESRPGLSEGAQWDDDLISKYDSHPTAARPPPTSFSAGGLFNDSYGQIYDLVWYISGRVTWKCSLELLMSRISSRAARVLKSNSAEITGNVPTVHYSLPPPFCSLRTGGSRFIPFLSS
ncbi:hypothetical protein B0H16DRAFT_1696768 [Mycena metata]|uniref:Uncharacterized protein n=1 Tax=Mycena metata TaxID=1033252 RepID=A0AAD7HYU1_9AGAR|nr:hypothetical protein B0H16DRAFT_1696768 [Mycena metata]